MFEFLVSDCWLRREQRYYGEVNVIICIIPLATNKKYNNNKLCGRPLQLQVASGLVAHPLALFST